MNAVEYQAFLSRQNEIYDSFRIPGFAMSPDKVVLERPSLAAVVFRYDESTRNLLGEMSQRIAPPTGLVAYAPAAIHTTVLSSGSLDDERLERLARKLGSAITNLSSRPDFLKLRPSNRLIGHRYNRTTWILSGEPNEDYVKMADMVIERCQEAISWNEFGRSSDTDVPSARMAHITLGRASETISGIRLDAFDTALAGAVIPGNPELQALTVVIGRFKPECELEVVYNVPLDPKSRF